MNEGSGPSLTGGFFFRPAPTGLPPHPTPPPPPSPRPKAGPSRRGRLRVMLRTAELLPPKGFRRWASTRPVSRPDRQPATEPPGSYSDGTHTRWRRRAYVGSATQKHLQRWARVKAG